QGEAGTQITDQRRQADSAGDQAQGEGEGDPAGFNHQRHPAKRAPNCKQRSSLVECYTTNAAAKTSARFRSSSPGASCESPAFRTRRGRTPEARRRAPAATAAVTDRSSRTATAASVRR